MTVPCQSSGEDFSYCPRFHAAIELIGRRWTGPILLALFSGNDRFGQLRDAVPGLSDRLLSERLKELEAAGVVERRCAGRDVSYHLTEHGYQLQPIIEGLLEWADKSPA